MIPEEVEIFGLEIKRLYIIIAIVVASILLLIIISLIIFCICKCVGSRSDKKTRTSTTRR
uniref:Uncharacterized protein n=1 Tax=Strongyloides stercoralis TaxID=6248 RepID=A0A913IBP1_STRER